MNSNEKKVHSLLGLATRAGKIVSGDDSTLIDLKKGKVSLVLVSSDASDNTKKLFRDKCSYRNVKLINFSTKSELGLSIGKAPRAVIGVKDKNFSNKIIEYLQ